MTWLAHHRTFFIYALLDRSGRARYVGMTTDLNTRRRVHAITARQSYRGRPDLRRWIREEGVNLLPLERVDGLARARAREAYWMDLFAGLGCPLLNQAGMRCQATLF